MGIKTPNHESFALRPLSTYHYTSIHQFSHPDVIVLFIVLLSIIIRLQKRAEA